MKDRKQHVIKRAHQLFIDKGFQATSIQDILEYSGISKGTFYNYFSSKNELLMELFKSIYRKLEMDRKELLIGQDPANIEIFIKQVELQMVTNRANKLISLFEEVIFSNDSELKEFIKRGQLRMLRWFYERFIDIFGESKKPYLLDCAIMFTGILQQNLKYYDRAHEPNTSIYDVVRYSVERVVKMVAEVADSGDQLLPPVYLENWLPSYNHQEYSFKKEFQSLILQLKKSLNSSSEQVKFIELLDFVHDELLLAREPRKYLVESALHSLKTSQDLFEKKPLQKFEQLVLAFLEI